jgi:hypothetical protein
MHHSTREVWVFRVELPAGVEHGGRFMARLLKHLGRRWGVRCIALAESAELLRLRQIIDGLADRVAAQAELLARRAEKESGEGSP